MLYRIMSNLQWEGGRKLTKGTYCLFKRTSPKTIDALLKKGRIVEWSVPPLTVLFRKDEEVLSKFRSAKISKVEELLATSRFPTAVQKVKAVLDINLVKEA